MSGAATAIVLLPWFANDYRLFSAWTPTTASVIVGANLHSWGIVLRYPDQDTVQRIFLLSRDVDWLISTSWLYLLGILTVTVCYVMATHLFGTRQESAQRGGLLLSSASLATRAVPVASALLAVSLLSLGLFVWQTGGLSGNSVSAKRTVIPGLSFDPEEFRTFGYLRFFNAGAVVATGILLYAWREKLAKPRYSFAIVVSVALSVAYPFYASNRSDIIGVVLAILVVLWVANVRIPRSTLLALVLIPMFVIGFATIARNTASETPESLTSTVLEGVVEPLVATQNYADLAKTAHIAAAVPDQLEHRNGSTYLAWLVAPVPRALWPEKPIIGTGPLIGTQIYGNARSGVPPGLFGEAVLNFGVLGLLIVSSLFGGIIAAADRWIYLRQNDPAAVIMYAVGLYRIGEFGLGQSLGEALLNSALGFALALPAVTSWLGRRRRIDSRPAAHPSKQVVV